MFAGREEEIYGLIETKVFEDHENLLGAGTTARIKGYEVTDGEKVLRLAIKYLVSPNDKTLSASGEHDMITEVERIQRVEEIEASGEFEHISVHHPYFHLKTSKIESYGMQLIEGFNLDLEQFKTGNKTISPELATKISELDLAAVNNEIERFFNRMHEYCLHGDIKPRNIMIDNDGKFYIIDFGQSVLAHEIDENGRDQFDQLKHDEIKATNDMIKMFVLYSKNSIANS